MAQSTMGIQCMKCTLFIFNFFFFLFGAALLALGIWGLVSEDTFLEHIIAQGDGTLQTVYILCVAVGVVLFLTGFLGCCGACMESWCMLATFGGILITIAIVQIAGVAVAAIYKKKINNELKHTMYKDVHESLTGDMSKEKDKAWYRLQYLLSCCGATGPIDYKESAYHRLTTSKYPIPPTCCRISNDDPITPRVINYAVCAEDLMSNRKDPLELHEQGCFCALKKWIKEHAIIFIGSCVGIAVIELIGIVFACYVCNFIRRHEQSK